MYVLSYLDRANIGYAKQAYQTATGITDAGFAFGAGISSSPTPYLKSPATW